MRIVLLFLLAGVASAQGISGVVVDSISHQPLKKVTINFAYLQPGLAQQRIQTSVTDDSGTFAFKLKPGRYQLVLTRPDYPVATKTVTVDTSDHPSPVTVEMPPGAVVSGRVLDEDGDPLGGCSIQVLPPGGPEAIDVLRRLVLEGLSSTARGEYRVTAVPAGKYVVTAQCDAPAFQPRPFSAGPDPPPSLAYPLQFYPGAPDVAAAAQIELTPGMEKAGIDFQMRPVKVTQVRVGLPALNDDVHVHLVPLSGVYARGFGVHELTCESGPACVFNQVYPDSYLLVATAVSQAVSSGSVTRVEARDKPVDVTVELKSAVEVSGRMEIETGSNSEKVHLSGTNVVVTPDYPEFVRGLSNILVSGGGGPVKEDGTFALTAIPGRWRFRVVNPTAFVKSAWLGSSDATGGALDLTSGAADTLRIVLSGNTATIRGTAPPGGIVAAYADPVEPNQPRGLVIADENGQFRIEGLAPGSYRLNEREITVQEGETATVDLRN